MRMSRFSSSVLITPPDFTPRSSMISGRVTGCVYAITASVSRAWMDSRVGDLGSSISRTQSLYSGRVVICQPPATSTSCSPRPSRAYSAFSSSRAACHASRGTPPITRVMSRGVTGWGEAKISASSTARTSAAGSTDSGVSSNGPPSNGGRARHRRPRLRPHGPEHANGPEQPALVDLDPLQADQLEQGEEGQDHGRLRLLGCEQLEELQRLSLAQHRQQLLHPLLDALALVLHLVGEQRLPPLQQFLERADQVVEAGLDHLLARIVEGRQRAVGPDPGGGADLALLVQQPRRLLVALELEQAPDQLLARILRVFFSLRLRGAHRHQHLRLDVDEGSGHDHVLPVLARDGGNGDVVDVHLVLLDEVEQQVERALELGQPDARRILGEDGL